MIRLIRPGPVPAWLPFAVDYSREDSRQWARIGCWLLAWNRGAELWLRPVFGGTIMLVECAGAENVRVRNTSVVGVKYTPLVPLAKSIRMRILQFGKTSRVVQR